MIAKFLISAHNEYKNEYAFEYWITIWQKNGEFRINFSSKLALKIVKLILWMDVECKKNKTLVNCLLNLKKIAVVTNSLKSEAIIAFEIYVW